MISSFGPYLEEQSAGEPIKIAAYDPRFIDISHRGYRVKIVADSINPDGFRLTTMVCTYPRFIHSEMMTHRVFSRNAASSRAIPFQKMWNTVRDFPAMPYRFTRDQKGMVGEDSLNPEEMDECLMGWNAAHKAALNITQSLNTIGVHKGQINRLLEPFVWMTTVISSTKWRGFFAQRCDNAADPTMRHIAELMRAAYVNNQPDKLQIGEYHLPFIQSAPDFAELRSQTTSDLKQISAARCARVSYLNQFGVRDIQDDLGLFLRLLDGPHWSPLEHVACVSYHSTSGGNFGYGWRQFRKEFDNENFGE